MSTDPFPPSDPAYVTSLEKRIAELEEAARPFTAPEHSLPERFTRDSDPVALLPTAGQIRTLRRLLGVK